MNVKTDAVKAPLLTGRQANVLDHALAFPKLTRNGFESTDGSANDDTWKELVELGFAERASNFSVPGRTKYVVTQTGLDRIKAYHDVETGRS